MTRARAVTTSCRPRRPSQPIPSAARTAKVPRPIERVDAQQGGPGRAGEGAVGDGVRREGRTSKDDEEADDTGDAGHHGGHDPSVGHESRKHPAYTSDALAPAATPVDAGSVRLGGPAGGAASDLWASAPQAR